MKTVFLPANFKTPTLREPSETIVVHAVDHCPILLGGLDFLTRIDARIVLTAKFLSPQKAIDYLDFETPNVLILQPQLDNFSADEFCEKLFLKVPKIGLIVYLRQPESKLLKKMRRLGARGFLDRSATPEEFIEAVYSVSVGNEFVQNSLLLLLAGQSLGVPIQVQKRPFQITKREKEVLAMIVDEMTNREIAEKLFVSQCTIETHRINLIQKLGVKNTAGLVRVAILNGML